MFPKRNNTSNRKGETRQTWDQAADTFDNEPDHGLHDPPVRLAWAELLRTHLPAPPSSILDIGCGTGSLSLVMAELGHIVTGIDFSPAMIARAQAKALAAGVEIQFQVMDAARPHLTPNRYDAIVCRHLLWALLNPAAVLRRWAKLLAPGGCLLLIEGFWHTGSGLHAQETVNALPPALAVRTVQDLSGQTRLWGRAVKDERYLIVAQTVY